MKHPACISMSGVFIFVAGAAGAAPVTIAAGQTYTLSADLTLSGADTLDANGTPSSPCIIVGNGHAIVTKILTGHLKIQNCKFQGLGGTMETSPALDLTAQDGADVTSDLMSSP